MNLWRRQFFLSEETVPGVGGEIIVYVLNLLLYESCLWDEVWDNFCKSLASLNSLCCASLRQPLHSVGFLKCKIRFYSLLSCFALVLTISFSLQSFVLLLLFAFCTILCGHWLPTGVLLALDIMSYPNSCFSATFRHLIIFHFLFNILLCWPCHLATLYFLDV
jgi:hypothetical protein